LGAPILLCGAANAFYAIRQHRAIGYSPFGIDNVDPLMGFGPDGPQRGSMQPQPDVETLPFSVAYRTLTQMAPLILEHQARGTIAAVSLNRQNPDRQIKLGGYVLNAGLPHNRRTPGTVPDTIGYGIFMATGADEFLLAGHNLQLTFTPDTAGPSVAGIARQENGHFESGKWVVTRYLGGDDSVLPDSKSNRNDFAAGWAKPIAATRKHAKERHRETMTPMLRHHGVSVAEPRNSGHAFRIVKPGTRRRVLTMADSKVRELETRWLCRFTRNRPVSHSETGVHTRKSLSPGLDLVQNAVYESVLAAGHRARHDLNRHTRKQPGDGPRGPGQLRNGGTG
jgi:hypothetical protein